MPIQGQPKTYLISTMLIKQITKSEKNLCLCIRTAQQTNHQPWKLLQENTKSLKQYLEMALLQKSLVKQLRATSRAVNGQHLIFSLLAHLSCTPNFVCILHGSLCSTAPHFSGHLSFLSVLVSMSCKECVYSHQLAQGRRNSKY